MAKAKKAAPKKLPAIKDAYNKTQILNAISDDTGLPKKDVASVMDSMHDLMARHIKKRGAGYFTVPGMMKIVTVRKPATKARKNVPNPFRPGELMDVAAKPARTIVKVRPLSKLKGFATD
jgi:nucleoid DNA-binding protein